MISKQRSAYLKKWREDNKELFKQLQVDWYRRRGKAHYSGKRADHLAANRRMYLKKLGLRSWIMSRIRSVSQVEFVARELASKKAGCSLRHQPKGIHGNPDYANKSRKVAVFVHGCWFHACPRHGKLPKTNVDFWRAKFKRNVRRHKEVSRWLRRRGWSVLTLWEHDVRSARTAPRS